MLESTMIEENRQICYEIGHIWDPKADTEKSICLCCGITLLDWLDFVIASFTE